MPQFQFPSRGGRARFRWHSCESRAVAVTSDSASSVYLLDGKTLALQTTVDLAGSSAPLAAFDWDEDGEELYMCASDSSILYSLDFATFAVARTDISPHIGTCVYASAEHLVVGTLKGALILVNRETKRKQVLLGRHTKKVLFTRVCNNNSVILSISDDRSIALTSVQGQAQDQVTMRNDVAFVRCKHNLCLFAVGGTAVYSLDTSRGLSSVRDLFAGLAGASNGLVVGVEFMTAATALIAFAQGSVIVLDLASSGPAGILHSYKHAFARIDSIAFSETSALCCLLTGDNSVTVWNTNQPLDALTVEKLPLPTREPKTLAISSDGQVAIVSCAGDFASVYSLVTAVPHLAAVAVGSRGFAKLSGPTELTVWNDVTEEKDGRKSILPFEPALLAVLGTGSVAIANAAGDVAVTAAVDGPWQRLRAPGVEQLVLNDAGVFLVVQGRVGFIPVQTGSETFPGDITPVTDGDFIVGSGRTLVVTKGKLLRIFLGLKEMKQYRHDSIVVKVALSSDGAQLSLVDITHNYFVLDLPRFLEPPALGPLLPLTGKNPSYIARLTPSFPGDVVWNSAGILDGSAADFLVASKTAVEFFRIGASDGGVVKVGEGGLPSGVGSEICGFAQTTVAFLHKTRLMRQMYSVGENLAANVDGDATQVSDEVVVARLRSGEFTALELCDGRGRRSAAAVVGLLVEAELLDEAASAIERLASSKGQEAELRKLARDRILKEQRTNKHAALKFVSQRGSLEEALVLAEIGQDKHAKDLVANFVMSPSLAEREAISTIANVLERRSSFSAAAEMHSMIGNFDKAVKLSIKAGDFDSAVRSMAKIPNTASRPLWGMFGRAKEARGLVKDALGYFEKAGDTESVVRVLCALGDLQKAAATSKANDMVGFEYLVDSVIAAHQRSSPPVVDADLAVQLLVHAGRHDTAFSFALANNKLDAYLEIAGSLPETCRRVAVEYEKTNQPVKAAAVWTKAGEYLKAFDLTLASGGKDAAHTELLIEIVSRAKAGAAAPEVLASIIPRLVSHISGESDGQPKHPKYAYAVYKALNQVEAADRALVLVAKQEAALGNYKEALSLLVKEFASAGPDFPISVDHFRLLSLLHSYQLIKRLADQDNHLGAALLCRRVVQNIAVFPKHAAQILTTAVIETVKADMRWEAYEYACELVKPSYRANIPDAIKPKIEQMVRKQKPGPEVARFSESSSACVYCHATLKDSSLDCGACLELLPFCVFSGLHMNDQGFCACASCGGLARSRLAVGPCPLCGSDVPRWSSPDEHSHVLINFKLKFKKSNN